jgi:hypothetical protein
MAKCERQAYCGHDEDDHVAAEQGFADRVKCLHCPCTYLSMSGPLNAGQKRRAGAQLGQEHKERELDRAEDSHASDLQAARLIRDRIALERVTVTADDVREVFEKHRGVNAWGPWAGALFRGKEYEATGEFRASVYATNHGAVIRVWRRRAM